MTNPHKVIDNFGDVYVNRIMARRSAGYQWGGDTAGFYWGGWWPENPTPPSASDIIQRFLFASGSTMSDVGTLAVESVYQNRGAVQDNTYGYEIDAFQPPIPGSRETYQRFPFACWDASNWLIAGDLNYPRTTDASACSDAYGYVSNYTVPPTPHQSIQRFAFATTYGSASNVGDQAQVRSIAAGITSSDYGYDAGGLTTPPPGSPTNVIERYPFAAVTTNATDVGDLNRSSDTMIGMASLTHGYCSSGPPAAPSEIDSWPFAASVVNATDIGNWGSTRGWATSVSSLENGYMGGGTSPLNFTQSSNYYFPFASGVPSSSAGTLAQAFYQGGSSQD